MLNRILRYFDLQSSRRSVAPIGTSGGGSAPVLPQYFTVAAGVVAEPFLRHYIEKGAWQIEIASLAGRVVFGLIIGIVILPGIYKSSFDPAKPLLVQLAALFPMGLGWQSLFTAATKIAT